LREHTRGIYLNLRFGMGAKLLNVKSEKPVVCVIGLGFVGLTLSITLCDAGFNVLGWEKNQSTSKSLASGETEIIEPGIKPKLVNHLNSGRFRVIDFGQEACEARIFIVTVGTPLLKSDINLSFLQNAVDQLVPLLKDNDLVIIRSTTAIGICRSLVLPKLSSTGKTIRLAMCPERTIEGKALDEMTSLPQIIGADDELSFVAASNFFSSIGSEVVKVSSLNAAELTKLINNTYRDLMFAFANEIAEIAQAYDVNPTEIIEAANKNYPRSNIALPGLSGGPCLEKDPWILAQSGRRMGLEMDLSHSSRKVNENVIQKFMESKTELINIPKRICVLGLAFKGNPVTQDTRGSAAFPLVEYLSRIYPEAEIVGFDPSGIEIIEGLDIVIHTQIEHALRSSDMVILLTNALWFNRIPPLISNYSQHNCVVLDFWTREFEGQFLPTQSYSSWSGLKTC
jgi:UDP-N-acetyl-D-mannosaminuronic acid dehydrogenase